MTAAPPPALLRASWRVPALAVVLVCAAATAVLGVRYHGEDEPGRLDAVLDPSLMVTSRAATGVLSVLVFLGSPPVIGLVIAVLALWAVVHRWWAAAALVVLGPGLAAVVTEFVLKPLVGRTLDGDLAFPSGHAVRAASISIVVLVLLATGRGPRRRSARVALGLVAVLVPAGAVYSLVGLTWHYTTDAIGGVLVAATVVLAIALALDAVDGSLAARTASIP